VKADRLGERIAALRRPALQRRQSHGRGGAVLLEAGARVELLDEADVVEERSDIEKLRVETDPIPVGERDGEEVAAEGMVGQKQRLNSADQILRLPREPRVGAPRHDGFDH
jgi:hypothetical protein